MQKQKITVGETYYERLSGGLIKQNEDFRSLANLNTGYLYDRKQ